MTNRAKHDASPQPELGFLANHKELLAIRVRPAEFARLLGVSKQAVSTWIRDGKVTINALDGLLDVRRAIQDVLRNTSPGRLRSRVLRQAVTDALELRENLARAEDRAEIAEAALQGAQEQVAHLERWVADGDAHADTFRALLIEHAEALRAHAPEAWEQAIDALSDAAWDVVDPETAEDGLADFIAGSEAVRAIHETEGGGE
jgi:predicted transcriptional regulator